MTIPGKNTLILLITLSAAAFAQKVDRIEINKNSFFSDAEIIKWAGLN